MTGLLIIKMYICLLDKKFLYEKHFNKYVALIEKHVICPRE